MQRVAADRPGAHEESQRSLLIASPPWMCSYQTMPGERSQPMANCCRLSFTATVLAVVPVVAVASHLVFFPLFAATGAAGEAVSKMFLCTLLGLPLAVLLGLAAIVRHAIAPRRPPGLALAVFAVLLASVELALFLWLVAQY